MTTHGGTRRGAGRKPKNIRFARQITSAEATIAKHLPDVAEALVNLAIGAWVEEEGREGDRIYQKLPNIRAITTIFDRIMGTPLAEIVTEEEEVVEQMDFSKLSKDELNALEVLFKKAKSTEK